jgi:hypothetical protein
MAIDATAFLAGLETMIEKARKRRLQRRAVRDCAGVVSSSAAST